MDKSYNNLTEIILLRIHSFYQLIAADAGYILFSNYMRTLTKIPLKVFKTSGDLKLISSLDSKTI